MKDVAGTDEQELEEATHETVASFQNSFLSQSSSRKGLSPPCLHNFLWQLWKHLCFFASSSAVKTEPGRAFWCLLKQGLNSGISFPAEYTVSLRSDKIIWKLTLKWASIFLFLFHLPQKRGLKKQNRAKQNKGGDANYWKKSRNKNPPALSKLVIFSILYLRISTSWKTQHPADQTEHRVFLRLPAHTQHWECKEINSWWMKTDFFW